MSGSSSLVIVTGTISSVVGSALANATGVAPSASFATATASSGLVSSTPAPGYSGNDPSFDIQEFLLTFADMLNVALGALEIGLVLAAMTFGVVVTKANSYFRGNTSDGALMKTTVASMLLLNVIQMIATIHGTYTAVVIDFGRLNDFASPEWSIALQILFTTLTASIAQIFFAFRLHAIMRNVYLTMIILFFTALQFATSIYSVVVLFNVGPLAILMFYMGDVWPMVVTFAVSAGINIVIAAVAYVRMQKPYVLQKHGRTTVMSELEYWTVKSLFFCGIVSTFNTVAVAIMMANMLWVAGTCVLGNLYTLSVLLNLNSRILAIPVASGTVRPRSGPQVDLSDRSSAATLTDDMAIWEDMVKSQAIKASLITDTKNAGLPEYTVGYQLNDGAVRFSASFAMRAAR
ncbi:hypothetical protein K466DRAFT_599441 [Polyporus arcularius HHB13444]|uniref:Uncharacterized protein n=1 Tax=Polyporus arcularius HHB13444 TaxID=1314778 RepID=A0A5C3PEP6_9APHY|nr:hypothetical protein K466DRAFT_599441 [Polyporus arcularius HHB13444]